ncbi:kinase [Thraustotheca clavata]|uniref:Kinase n=1 Tax=Thraustotheca clavata TaxID=74557 RepID=A0A1V9YTW4_9STRA|nr:kinase [Thraustotheca clavata]
MDLMLITEFMDAGDLRNMLEISMNTGLLPYATKLIAPWIFLKVLCTSTRLTQKYFIVILNFAMQCLNLKMQAKITDFGVSQETYDDTLTTGIGTYRWMAPETLQDAHYTEAADIFSFGVILAELDNHIIQYSDVKDINGRPLNDTAIMAKVMHGKLRPTLSHACPMWYKELCLSCMYPNPLESPTAIQLSYQLKIWLRQLA